MNSYLEEKGTSEICPIIAITRGSKILIGLRHYTPEKWKATSVWTLPGGRCEDGEKVEATLRREVAEEVGITQLDINSFLGRIDGAKEGDMVYVFIGSTSQEPQLMEPEKFSEWKWKDIDRIPENFINLNALSLIRKFIHNSSALTKGKGNGI